MSRNIFCSRKKGVTRQGRFSPAHTVSQILEKQIEKQARKLASRRHKAEMKKQARHLNGHPMFF